MTEHVDDGERGYQTPPTYLPSPTEIAAECQAIRATWTPTELRSRAAWAVESGRVDLPTARADFFEETDR